MATLRYTAFRPRFLNASSSTYRSSKFTRSQVSLLTSTLRMLPPKYGQVESSKDGLKYSLCKPFSLTSAPSVSLPVDTVDDLPVSAQVVAPAFDDDRALQCARLIERVA